MSDQFAAGPANGADSDDQHRPLSGELRPSSCPDPAEKGASGARTGLGARIREGLGRLREGLTGGGKEPVAKVAPVPALEAAPADAVQPAPAPALEVAPDGSVVVGPGLRLDVFPAMPGQPDGMAYALVEQGLPLPPGGAAYVLELPAETAGTLADAAEAPAVSAAPEPPAPAPAASEAPAAPRTSAAIVAYIDAYGRAFSCGSVQQMPPARTPDVRFARYASDDRRGGFTGCIEVGVSKGKTARLAAYTEDEQGLVSIGGTRADFGGKPAGLTATQACAVAFLALWLFPRKAGVELTALSVKDVLAHLRTPNLFEAIDDFAQDVRRGASHPLLAPPAVLTYFEANLRTAGLVGLKPADLASHGASGVASTLSAVESLMAGLPMMGVAGPGASVSLPEGVTTIHASVPAGGDIVASIQRALAEAGITGLTFAGGTGPDGQKIASEPSVRLVRTTSYANLFYASFDRRQVSADGARKLLEAEALLNRLVLTVERLDRDGAVQTATLAQVAAADERVVDGIAALADPYLDNAVEKPERTDTGSADLDVRLAFARGMESLRLPYRLEYAFGFDAKAGDLVVDVAVPSSGIMPRLVSADAGAGADAVPASAVPTDAPAPAPDPAVLSAPSAPSSPEARERTYPERERLATRYALHLAGVVAAVAFWSGAGVARVTVNCWHGKGAAAGVDELAPLDGGLVRGPVMEEPACVLSLRVGRRWFDAHMAPAEARAAFDADPNYLVEQVRDVGEAAILFDDDPADQAAVRLQPDDDGHLCRVRPIRDLEDPHLRPKGGADTQPDLDERSFDDRGRALFGVASVRDLAIYENASRRAAAAEIADALEQDGPDAALAAVKDAHDRTENLLVRQACLQVEDGIASGALGEGSRRRIDETFNDVYGLQAGMRAAYRALQSDPAAACAQLERMLSEVDERVVFADTSTRRYRYFDSYAARVLYGLRCPEASDGRELRLCADEYFLCHYRLASVLAESLDHAEDAIAHARRCVELGPSVASAYLRLARCYFSVFDYLSEIETLRDMLRIAWNPTDVGLALYWLGYAFCLVDKPEVGMACYQTCTEYDPSLTEAAVTEASDFMRRKGDLPKSYSEAQRAALLAGEGIDLAQVRRNVDDLMRAAGAAVDAGAWGLARNLLGAAEATLRDDALPPVEESLEG